MYRSKHSFKAPNSRHKVLETVESTIQQHRGELEAPTLEVPYDARSRHIYCIGKTQHGKSTLLHSIISQDIENGAGVCVLDPKPTGEKPNLVDSVLRHIRSTGKAT